MLGARYSKSIRKNASGITVFHLIGTLSPFEKTEKFPCNSDDRYQMPEARKCEKIKNKKNQTSSHAKWKNPKPEPSDLLSQL